MAEGLGLEIDDAIVVKCEDGKLVFSKAENGQREFAGVSQIYEHEEKYHD